MLKDFLDESNEQLLHDFGWGSQGASEFSQFMREVRKMEEQYEMMEETLRYIAGDVEGHVYADNFDEARKAACMALDDLNEE